MGGRSLVLAALMPLIVLAAAGCGDQEGRTEQPGGGISVKDFERRNMQWRDRRLERLTEPYGWLSLIGLEMLEPDSSVRVGAGRDNDVIVPRGPARWGMLHVDARGRTAEFEVAAGAGVIIDGRETARAPMRLGGDAEPTRVEAAGIRMHLVDPGGRLGLRIRDPQAPSREGFAGLDYFPLDPGWCIEAEFIAHPEGTTIQVANVMGQLVDEPNPGRVRFTRDGKTITLEAVQADDELFFIFADRTSGSETYGLGRFLYSDLPEDGRVILDFNQAYNPPCAFNAYTTCSLPPQQNRIDTWVRAGEKKYAGIPGIVEPKARPGRVLNESASTTPVNDESSE